MREVIIVGGGVVGVCTAWYLRQAGMEVTLLDKGDFSDGCSFGNAGMIVPSHFTPLASPGMMAKGINWMFKKGSPFYIRPRLDTDLLRWLWLFYKSSTKKHVEECAAWLSDLHTESREAYNQWNLLPGFSFGFEQRGILMLYQSDSAGKDEIETAEKAHALGMEAHVLSSSQVQQLEPDVSVKVLGGVHYPGDAHLSPDIFLRQMIQRLKEDGVGFLSGHEVVALQDGESGCALRCRNGTILEAKQVVVATGAWTGLLGKSNGMKLPMQDGKGYSFTMDLASQTLRIPSILHEARVAITPMGGRLRISGTLEISGMDAIVRKHKVKSIADAVPGYYPDLQVQAPAQVWYGYRPCTPDGMPYIGRWKDKSSVILASGHGMMGLSLAPATGRMVRDVLVENTVTPSVLRPSRFD